MKLEIQNVDVASHPAKQMKVVWRKRDLECLTGIAQVSSFSVSLLNHLPQNK